MSSPKPPPAKAIKLDFADIVTVLVGKEEHQVVFPRDLLTRRSAFFKAAFDGEFREAKEKTVRLPEVSMDTFSIYSQFVYTGNIVLLDPEQLDKDKNGSQRYEGSTKLYILADQLGDVDLQNKIIDYSVKIMSSVRKGPGRVSIALAYQGLPNNATLLRFIVDVIIRYPDSKWLKDNQEFLPEQFYVDLACGFAKVVKDEHASCHVADGLNTFKGFAYHEHNEAVPKCE